MMYELINYEGYSVYMGELFDLQLRLIKRRFPFDKGILELEDWDSRKDVLALHFVDRNGVRVSGLEPSPTRQFLLDLYSIKK